MLSDCDAAANKTNADTEYQCYRNQCMEHLIYRYSTPSGIAAPINPITIPSTTNGARTK